MFKGVKKYCTIDELVYNRIMFLKNNNKMNINVQV